MSLLARNSDRDVPLATTKAATHEPSLEMSASSSDAWRRTAVAILGAWLASNFAAMEYRSLTQLLSDIACGAALVALAIPSWRRGAWAPWAVAAIACWLMLAPLVFWTREAAVLLSGWLIGSLAFCLAVVVPGSHGARDLPGRDAPPGWSYNPSAWPQRAGIIVVALIQFFIARHLAAYQLGHVSLAWDPFFGDGTRDVLESDVSKAFPVSDAGLGAVMYLIEALTGFLGGTRRWRTMPWAVLLFGVLIIPVGIVSTVLVILQPLAVGAWCGLCLVTAALTVFLIAPAVDEVVCTGHYLLRERRAGRSLWRAFWMGGEWPLDSNETEQPDDRSLARRVLDGLELTNVPWNLPLVVALGAWLMAAPAVLGSEGALAGSDQLCGALVITFAAIGFGDASRAVRWLGVPLGLWIAASPWILEGGETFARWSDLATGAAIAVLSVRRGPIQGSFGGWRRFIF
jgi:uncharacterized membrane protein